MIKNILKPFDDMTGFIEEKSILSLQNYCKNLRSIFGPAFSDKAVKLILLLRTDLDKLEKSDVVEACKHVNNT